MQDEDDNTPLIQSCRRGRVETARVLVEHRANVDQQNNVSSIIQWNSSKTDTIGTNNFVCCSEVSLAQGLVRGVGRIIERGVTFAREIFRPCPFFGNHARIYGHDRVEYGR